jgi:DNA-binding SARP family transcriptional activator
MALRTYQRCREVLTEEFGVDPLPETSELYDQILNDELD